MSNFLANLQNDFQDYLLGRSECVVERVDSTPDLNASLRLGIYHNAYRARLVEVLMDTYERVVPYIGEESFESAALAFIESNPPSARSVRDYGASFPEFLADYFEQDLEVAELAAMDKRLRDTFDAPDAEPLGIDDVAALQPEDWETVTFKLHPTVSIQEFNWNTIAIWQNLGNDETPPSAAKSDAPVFCLFWRKDLQPHFRSLSTEEHAALRFIVESRMFGHTCDLLADAFPELDVTSHVAAWLQTWLHDGILDKTFTLSKPDY